jgi:poly(hydroxyalkanoate) depolymerase family esterase
MVRLLRRWFKKMGIRPPFLPRSYPLGRGRFLQAKFKDSSAPAPRSSRPDISFRLYLPSGSSRRDTLPLIVMLHGCRQDALSFAEGTRMNEVAEEHRCAVLYPEQNRRSNSLRCWNWFEPSSLAGLGEAALITRLIDQVANRRPIDPRRIYVVGMSAGGAMACILAVRHSRLFAACAIHSGVMYGMASSPMAALAAMRSGSSSVSLEEARQLMTGAGESAVPVPTLVIHGDRDTTVNPLNADQIIEQLKARAELSDASAGPLVASSEQRVAGGGRTYRQLDYQRQGRILLRSILVEGLGHAWSGGDPRHEFNDDAGPDASRLIADFVMQY